MWRIQIQKGVSKNFTRATYMSIDTSNFRPSRKILRINQVRYIILMPYFLHIANFNSSIFGRHKPRLIETQNLLPTIALPALPPCPWRETEREALALFDDPRIRSAEERQVLCVGCDTWCTLRDTYYMEDWEAHAGSCAALKAQGIKYALFTFRWRPC